MKNLNIKGVQALDKKELREVEGGLVTILKLTGVLDGIPDNTHLYFFKWRIF